MLFYQLSNALRNIRRHPILSGLVILAIAIGVAMATAAVTVYHIYSGDPIPEKSSRLFHVQLDNWPKNEEVFDSSRPDSPPPAITYRDMLELMKSDIPTYQSGMYATFMNVHPDRDGLRTFGANVEMCYADFFPMFDVPFEYGSGWDKAADKNADPVVVLDAKTNAKLFGGKNSVGETLRIESQLFTIVGVLKPWRPKPRFFDLFGDSPAAEPQSVYMPAAFTEKLVNGSNGSFDCPSSVGETLKEPTFKALLQTECIWIDMWVELDDARQEEAYLSFLNTYVMEQKKLGRFDRPLNNRLLPVMAWLKDREVVPDESKNILFMSLMFLFICSVSLIEILLSKFLAHAPEMMIRRALGATRIGIFLQHWLECEVFGIAGGILGLGLSLLVINFVNHALRNPEMFTLDATMIGAGLLLSLTAGLFAGIYPAWRICKVVPALQLKLQ